MADLTDKQQAFIDHYFLCGFNGTEAAARAGYDGERETLAVVASENLRKPNIREAIDARMAETKMSANEVLARLGEHARGNIVPFLVTDHDGNLESFDLSDDKPLHLLKKASITESEFKGVTKRTVTIELYDAQSALVHIGRHYGLFVDKTALTDPTGTQEYADTALDALRQRLITQLATESASRGSGDIHPDATASTNEGGEV